MGEGDSLAGAKNYSGAARSYSDAASIKPNGPGDPQRKIADMNRLAQGGGSTGGGTTVATNPNTGGNAGGGRTTVTSAVVANTPKVDVAQTLKEADAAKAHKDLNKALGLYQKVLSADSRNAEAKAGIDEVQRLATESSRTLTASSEAASLLAKGIGEFYTQNFDDAEFDIRLYLQNKGGKAGMAEFYLGALRLTKYFLGGEKENKLMTQAEEAFKAAKKDSGFKAPERMVSPKIVKKFNETT